MTPILLLHWHACHVDSARLDRLPATRTIWKMTILLSLGFFFELYDLPYTGYIAPGLVKSGILTTTTHGLFGMTGIASFIAELFLGLFVWWIRRQLPESPRWLAQQGRLAEAEQVMAELERKVAKEYGGIIAIAAPPGPMIGLMGPRSRDISLEEISN